MASPLITVDQLADPPPQTVLDVRWQLSAGAQPDLYASGHIPGAAFVDLDRDLAAPPGSGGRHPLAAAEDFERAMRSVGVTLQRPVVVYDDAKGLPAARAWWLLRYFGHRQVALLDGGLEAWLPGGGRPGQRGGVSAPAGGETEPMDPVAGHIPGALNWPLQRNLDADGRFLDQAELAEALGELTGS